MNPTVHRPGRERWGHRGAWSKPATRKLGSGGAKGTVCGPQVPRPRSKPAQTNPPPRQPGAVSGGGLDIIPIVPNNQNRKSGRRHPGRRRRAGNGATTHTHTSTAPASAGPGPPPGPPPGPAGKGAAAPAAGGGGAGGRGPRGGPGVHDAAGGQGGHGGRVRAEQPQQRRGRSVRRAVGEDPGGGPPAGRPAAGVQGHRELPPARRGGPGGRGVPAAGGAGRVGAHRAHPGGELHLRVLRGDVRHRQRAPGGRGGIDVLGPVHGQGGGLRRPGAPQHRRPVADRPGARPDGPGDGPGDGGPGGGARLLRQLEQLRGGRRVAAGVRPAGGLGLPRCARLRGAPGGALGLGD